MKNKLNDLEATTNNCVEANVQERQTEKLKDNEETTSSSKPRKTANIIPKIIPKKCGGCRYFTKKADNQYCTLYQKETSYKSPCIAHEVLKSRKVAKMKADNKKISYCNPDNKSKEPHERDDNIPVGARDYARNDNIQTKTNKDSKSGKEISSGNINNDIEPKNISKQDDPEILKKLKGYNNHRAIFCMECGYNGLMGIEKRHIPWYLTMWVLIPIVLTGVGIIPAVILGALRASSTKHTVRCPNCDLQLLTK